MPTQEDRIATLEQTAVSRIDFIDAINRLTLQQAQMASDMSHQVTILLGVTASQGQDIRTLKADVSALAEGLGRLETKFDEHTSLLTEILGLLRGTR